MISGHWRNAELIREFDLIHQLSCAQNIRRDEVALGIGDDAAVLDVPTGKQLVMSTDTLNPDVHFSQESSASDIGYKSLAVNLSDIAAMGAEPVAASLSLSLPELNTQWLQDFSRGFFALADYFKVQLVGGDTVQGPLSISVTAYGLVEKDRAITRSGACPGDSIYVTGVLGDAGAALLVLQGELSLTGSQASYLMERLHRPVPRVGPGQSLQGIASSMIDISDGLAADLGHILENSSCGAMIRIDQLPISAVLDECFESASGYHCPLYGGDDYELCFTVPEYARHEAESMMMQHQLPVSCVGTIEEGDGLRLLQPDGTIAAALSDGYQHF